MEWVATIQQAIVYMEDHLLEPINYEDVARQVHISGYEFHRAFSFLTGMTPNGYLRSRRLSLAGKEVTESEARITDIALKYGYDTPESFSKAFSRFHGISPRQAREEGGKLVLFNPFAIKLTVEGGKSMDYRITHAPQQKFLAIVGSFDNQIINDDDNHDIPDFWDECQKKDLIAPLCQLRQPGCRDVYGLCSPAKEGQTSFQYGIGIRIDEHTAEFDLAAMQEKGYCIWEVEPATYAVFDCIGEDGDCISQTWAKFYQEFLPQMGYEAAESTDYEIYPEQGAEGVFCQLWIPVKRK